MKTEITHTRCPDCGSDLKEETRFNRHCNSYWNERRVFDCGAKFEFSPNYMATTQTKNCGNSNEAKAALHKQQEALRKTRAYIGKLDVDPGFKAGLLERLPHD